jgi:hypothetical protein
MKLVAEGDKIILKREEVFSKSWEAIKKLGLVMPDKPEHKDLTKVNPNPTVFGRIVSIGPDYKGETLKLGMLVVFGTAAQVKFRDGSEFVITTPGGILARVEDDAEITPASLGPRAGAGALGTGGENGTTASEEKAPEIEAGGAGGATDETGGPS